MMYVSTVALVVALAAQTAVLDPHPNPVDSGTPSPATAPAEHWRCTYDNRARPPFAFTVQNGRLTRYRSEIFTLAENNSIGLVGTRSLSQVELGKPAVGTYVFALDRRSGAFVFDAVFTAGPHNSASSGTCVQAAAE